ncbi:hypothetical protein TcCL_NonESM11704 [Trypanosoma cruzi]|nr:hypothetical protein TcCL_NonESM11704 [Trypanosoma cruzi]
MSNSAEYYRLVEEGRRRGRNWWQQSACLFSQGMETRGAETTLLLPTTIRRFVRVMEGATDMPVACTPRVTDGSRLVDDRLSTKVPEERCTPGGFETTGLRPIDDVVRDAVLQWCFLLSRSVYFFSLLPVCFCRGGVGGMRCGCGVDRVIHALCWKRYFELCYPRRAYLFLLGVFWVWLSPFSPICLLIRSNAPPLRIAVLPWRWIEQMPGDLQAEPIEVCLNCCRMTMGGEQTGEERAVAATRAVL